MSFAFDPSLVAADAEAAYGGATRLLITVASGTCDSYRQQRWKLSLQQPADELGLAFSVCNSLARYLQMETRLGIESSLFELGHGRLRD
jgi:hypothetical protein